MVELVRSWGHSLLYLAPSSLKAWALLTFKGSLDAYKTLLRHFWWLIILIIGCAYYLMRCGYPRIFGSSDTCLPFVLEAYFISTLLWFLVTVLAVRPSTQIKHFGYYASYYKHCLAALTIAVCAGGVQLILGLLLAWLIIKIDFAFFHSMYSFKAVGIVLMLSFFAQTVLLVPLQMGWLYYTHYLFLVNTYFNPSVLYIQLAYACMSIPILFMMFFNFDCPKPFPLIFKNMWRGFKMTTYTYPLCLLICALLQLISYAAAYANLPFNTLLSFEGILFPVYVTIIKYIYVKQLYAQPERYQ